MSDTWLARARRVMPGGVNSPVRAFGAVGGEPPFVTKASGAFVETADGETLIDFVASWGALIFGHAHRPVVDAVTEAARRGTSFGLPSVAEVELAELIVETVPSVEVVRMVNSGTEATASAVRVARAATARPKIVKFEGCYHGHADPFLVKAGSGVATMGLPDSPGVPAATVADTVLVPFNDLDAVSRAFAGGDVAAVIVEPVAGNMGVVPPDEGFLPGLRELCDRFGALLIFDEVMTGFRVALGGAQERYGVLPDLTCLGKVVAGGTPAAAYGGREDLMRLVAPDGPVYQAGTLAGNPLAVAAGLTTLRALQADPGVYDRLETVAATIAEELRRGLARRRIDGVVQRVGSMLTLFFGPERVRSWNDASQVDRERFARFHRAALERGVLVPPSPFEAWFVMAAHEGHVDQVVSALDAALGEVA